LNSKLDIETTIPSYLAAMPSRDLLVAAHQQITREWWADRRLGFNLYVSELVLRECSAGDAVLAATRAEVIRELPVLRITTEALELADVLVSEGLIPRRAAPRLMLSTCRLLRLRLRISSYLELQTSGKRRDSAACAYTGEQQGLGPPACLHTRGVDGN